MTSPNVVQGDSVANVLESALDAGGGLLRLTPTWVPRSFLHPGKRIRLHQDDWYAYGAHRGGIDERWFASTTDAANEGRVWHEGQSFCSHEGQQFLLKDAVAEAGNRVIGPALFSKYNRWPVYSKFFDNMGPIPHHMHQSQELAKLTGQEGKPESYYFAPQYNNCDNNFPYTFMGLEPGTTKADVRKCLEDWSKGDNGILDLSKAYRLKRGTGWLIPPCVLHAPGSLCTYEPQWGSDVFGMYQSLVEGREVPWSLLVKDVPEDKHQDLDFIVEQLDWEKNVDPNFKDNNYLEPITDDSGDGWQDDWIVYGLVDGQQLFSSKRLTLQPGAKCTLKDPGASGWITVQGEGRMGNLKLQTPTLIRFGQATDDEVFITHEAATAGVEIENTGSEPLEGLRYFGPDTFNRVPSVGDYKKLTSVRYHGTNLEIANKEIRIIRMTNPLPKLHNAMWPGLVGKGDEEGQEPPISLEKMLQLTAAAEVNGQKFEGIDYFLFHPHTDPNAGDDELKKIADLIQGHGFNVGSLVAPVWPGTVGDSAMGDADARAKFLEAVKVGCRIAGVFNEHGVRKYGCIRIDSAEFGVEKWREDAPANTKKIAETFREAAKIAADHGERLAAEGEICWAGMHSWKDMLDLLEEVGMPQTLGFQADMAHTYLYLMGYNAPEHALLHEGYSDEEFYAAYEKMVDKLRPWTIDFHIAQNDGEVHGAGDHDKTGKHCRADDPNGKLDIVKCAGYWLKDAPTRGIEHICWDGCMFPNAVLEDGQTWNTILDAMIKVRDAHGWN